MENEIFGEFRMKLGWDVVMSNYWCLTFILSCSMNERERFVDLVKIIVSTFKDDAESSLVRMKILLQLVEPPFQRGQRNIIDEAANNADEGASNANMEEDEFSMNP